MSCFSLLTEAIRCTHTSMIFIRWMASQGSTTPMMSWVRKNCTSMYIQTASSISTSTTRAAVGSSLLPYLTALQKCLLCIIAKTKPSGRMFSGRLRELKLVSQTGVTQTTILALQSTLFKVAWKASPTRANKVQCS